MLPPICRWDWSEILLVGGRLAIESPYAIAKSIGESHPSLLHLKSWIVKAGAVILELARNEGLLSQAEFHVATPSPIASLSLACRWSSWAEFTHSFSRVLYPKRFLLLSSHTILTG
jgi:hypothetical protein